MFIELTDVFNRETIINTDNITYMNRSFENNCTHIYFGIDETKVSVLEPIEHIVDIIKNF